MTAEDSITSLQFQILGSSAKDVEHEYQIVIFGATAEGYSVSLAVTGFEPYFYVEMPSSWSSTDRATYQQFLTKRLNAKEKSAVSFAVEKHKSFWDFTNNQRFSFLKIQTRSKRLWTKLRDICQDRDTCLPIPYKGETLRVFEANIDPMLRFFHLRELKPAGWLFVHEDHWEQVEDPTTTTVIQATTEVAYVCPAPPEVQLTAAPLKIMSWDIECTSSHGDFPLAVKDWRKPAREIVAAGLKDWATVEAAILAAASPGGATGTLSRIYLGPAIRELTLGLKAAAEEWTSTSGDDAIDKVNDLLSRHLPPPEGDPIIQIGCVLYINNKAVRKDIFVLGSCTPVADQGAPTHTHVCATEGALIRGWCRLIQEIDPDIMVGYNIFGFDDKYLWDRATVTRTTDALKAFSRCTDKEPELQEKRLSSSAMGDNIFHVITGLGRLHIDLLAYVRRNAVLDSYSLDNVTATFMSGSVISVKPLDNGLWSISTKSTKGTSAGRYMVIMDEENDVIGDKLEIVAVEPKALHVRMLDNGLALKEHSLPPVRWSQAKDDVSPKEIFALHAQGPSERAKVAKYCIQDCDLVMELMQKLEVLNNSVAMANVCWVPVEFIFTRGQGIKSESLVFYECRKEGQLIPVLPAPPRRKDDEPIADLEIAEVPEPRWGASSATPAADVEIIQDDNEGYEGAIVLDPLSGIYLDNEPVAALDFSSLYPSSIISENLSHDSVVWVKDYDLKGQLVAVKEGSETYDNLPGWEYLEVDYDILRSDPNDKRKHPPLKPAGRRVCRFAQPVSPDGKTNNHNEKSTLPKILQKLLSQRKATRKLAEKETDDFKKSLLDAQQLAYKLTANSLYGQLGSNTSKIRRKCIAASTTGHGRQQLLFSKACIEQAYGPSAGDSRCDAVCVYGDTDSVFISFRPKDPITGERLTGRPAQEAAKALAEEAGHKISGALKPPHDFEFDKMFRCFCLLSKKRYVGDMTEGGLEDSDYHRKSMGIVMKRRDNAPIVKYVYGGVIERILNQRDVVAAFQFVKEAAAALLAGKFPVKRLTITKSLRAEYKLVPAHKILADRMGKRDPGNKPSSNDRIPFMYVMQPSGRSWPASVSQGERIETPAYAREQSLKPDYTFYITNQIAKPVAQVFGLVVEQLPGVKAHQIAAAKTVEAREKLAEELLFGDLVRDARRDAAGQKDLRSWFQAK
jgi:DNA polymerase elongation subunit (family B)